MLNSAKHEILTAHKTEVMKINRNFWFKSQKQCRIILIKLSINTRQLNSNSIAYLRAVCIKDF